MPEQATLAPDIKVLTPEQSRDSRTVRRFFLNLADMRSEANLAAAAFSRLKAGGITEVKHVDMAAAEVIPARLLEALRLPATPTAIRAGNAKS